MKNALSLAVAAALALAALPQARADITFSGFGQIVAGTTTEDGESLFGYDDDLDFRNESLFALQARAGLNEQFSATAQIVARGAEDFDPEFAWAYLTWQPSDAISIKLGRQRAPYYRYSDFLEVGYAYPWLRPPQAVYNLGAFSIYEGINAAWSGSAGSWETTAQFIYGDVETDVDVQDQPASWELQGLTGVTLEGVYDGWLTLRAGYFVADVSLDAEALAPLFTTLDNARLGAITRALDIVEDEGSFLGLGFEIDHSNVVVIGEYDAVEVEDTFISERDEYYLTAGYRFGTVLPTITYGRRDNPVDASVLAGIPPQSPLFAPVAGIALSDESDDTYTSIGVRWDFARNTAFKADFTRFRSDVAFKSDADVLSAGIVFTF